MIVSTFNTFIYDPLYNGLVFLVDYVPGHDIGIAVIALTIIVRFLILPLSKKAVQAQIQMREIAPDVEKLKQKHKGNREEQSRAIFALYKERDVHPFASLGLILVQFPILIGLYLVFYKGGFPAVDTALLYSFVPVPDTIDMHFLGLLDMGERSYLLAAFAGISQFIYTRLSMGPAGKTATPVEATFSSDMARSFEIQTRYVFPVIIAAISAYVAAAAPLYWTTSNLFMIAQEYLMGRRFSDPTPKKK